MVIKATLIIHLVFHALALLSSSGWASAQDVVSVGGFVTVSSSFGSTSVDLSTVRVSVLDSNGVKRSEGDCSPNGYYFVPVDPGTYIVKVRARPGWLFSPSEVQILCDHQTCNNADDVNFVLTGVQLSGHVEPGVSAASCRAAASSYDDVTVTIRPAASGSTAGAVATVVVHNSGFSAGPLLPGDYVVTATHPEWQLQPSHFKHTVGLGSTQLPTPFKVAGYRLSGGVTSKSGPVAGIQVTLLSSDLESAGCSKSHPPGSVVAADIETALSTTALCSVLTDNSGRYTFSGVPCGRYTLQAQHPDPSSTFEIQPASMAATVGHGNALVSEQFVVTGFSVTGRVVDAAGVGVAGVSIMVGVEERATTDLNGRYVMPRMNEGRLDLTASKKHYAFSSLKAVHITPGAQMLPDIIANSLAVCGRLSSGDARFKVSSRRVSLTSIGGASGPVAEQVSTDADGSFCFMVPPGRYRVAPYVTSDEKSKGLVFSPTHSDFEISGKPVLHLSFDQAQLTVTGAVECFDGPCPGDIQLSLRDLGGKVVQAARLDEVAVRDKQTTGSTTAFTIPRISPGRYHLSASRNGWCWASDIGVEVVVEAADVQATPLLHTGYQLQISSSHPTELQISGASLTAPLTLQATEGRSAICIPGSGKFAVTTKGCFLFGAEEFAIHIKPSSPPDVLVLKAVQVQISGQVAVIRPLSLGTTPKEQGATALPSEITIKSTITGSEAAAGVVVKALPSKPAGEQSPTVYTYQLAVGLGSTLVLTPSVSKEYGLLFYPGSQVVKHNATSRQCPPDAGVIEARAGLRLTGSTDPAVEGAEVEVYYKFPSAAAGVAAGDLAAQAITDAAGSFEVWPLHDDAAYTVMVHKSGHVFSSTSGTAVPPQGLEVVQSASGQLEAVAFKSKQLAQVSVVVDLPQAVEPSAVFLSLSAAGGFKNNARLGPDNTLAFLDLQPGTYYLKPLLREHRFEPPVAEMQLTEGQAEEVRLTAVRTAWGISGVVTSVGGSPLAGARVEACEGLGAAAVVLDNSVTDESGRYRIGNLKPGISYTIRVKLDGRVTSAHPASVQVDLKKQDVQGVDFTAARTSSRSALSAALKLPHRFRTAIKAELLPAAAGSSSAATTVAAAAAVAVDASGFFELRGLKPGAYVLKLSCDAAAAGGLSCEPWTMPVQVPHRDIHLGVLPFKPATTNSGGSTAAAAVTAHLNISEEGLDWKMPLLVLTCLVAGGFTVLKPAIVDILQLKATTVHNGSANNAASSFAMPAALGSNRVSANGGLGTANASTKAAAMESNQASAVAAAAAVGFDDDEEDEVTVVRQRGAVGTRSRARRA